MLIVCDERWFIPHGIPTERRKRPTLKPRHHNRDQNERNVDSIDTVHKEPESGSLAVALFNQNIDISVKSVKNETQARLPSWKNGSYDFYSRVPAHPSQLIQLTR